MFNIFKKRERIVVGEVYVSYFRAGSEWAKFYEDEIEDEVNGNYKIIEKA